MEERIRHHCLIGVAGKNGYKKKNCNSCYRKATVGLSWTEMREQLSREDDQKSVVKVKMIMNDNHGRNVLCGMKSRGSMGHEDQWGRRLECWPNKAARLAGWRKVTRQVWFCTRWTGRTACLFRTVPVALKGAAQLRADGISNCCIQINVHNNLPWATSHKEGIAWYSSRPMPSLLGGPSKPILS